MVEIRMQRTAERLAIVIETRTAAAELRLRHEVAAIRTAVQQAGLLLEDISVRINPRLEAVNADLRTSPEMEGKAAGTPPGHSQTPDDSNRQSSRNAPFNEPAGRPQSHGAAGKNRRIHSPPDWLIFLRQFTT